jgi:hypothetical protein
MVNGKINLREKASLWCEVNKERYSHTWSTVASSNTTHTEADRQTDRQTKYQNIHGWGLYFLHRQTYRTLIICTDRCTEAYVKTWAHTDFTLATKTGSLPMLYNIQQEKFLMEALFVFTIIMKKCETTLWTNVKTEKSGVWLLPADRWSRWKPRLQYAARLIIQLHLVMPCRVREMILGYVLCIFD